MMETFDIAKVDKIQGFQKFIYGIRDNSGGLIMCLIIPPALKDLMLDPKLEEPVDDVQEFYLYGWYNQHSFPIYIDKTITDCIYIICNLWSKKVKVHSNG